MAEPLKVEKYKELDVRPFHARGEEPFQAIMQTVDSLEEDEAFVLLVGFEPKPLYGVLGKKGFKHHVERPEPGLYRITFYRE